MKSSRNASNRWRSSLAFMFSIPPPHCTWTSGKTSFTPLLCMKSGTFTELTLGLEGLQIKYSIQRTHVPVIFLALKLTHSSKIWKKVMDPIPNPGSTRWPLWPCLNYLSSLISQQENQELEYLILKAFVRIGKDNDLSSASIHLYVYNYLLGISCGLDTTWLSYLV